MQYFEDYFWPCLTFLWAWHVWDAYLAYRQRGLYRAVKTVPAELRNSLDQETFDKSRLYQLDRSTFAFYHELYSQCEVTLFLLCGAFPWLWRCAGRLSQYIGYNEEYEMLQSVMFMLLALLLGDVLELPWLVYQTFVIEERHGFNKQTVRFFIWDQLKGLILQLVLNPLVMVGMIFFIEWGGDHFYYYTWLFLFVVTMAWMTIFPTFIQPMFDTYTPLPSGDLKTAIQQLAATLHFPLKKVFVVDGSTRSNHSNAYFYGFWNNKRIVLFDTLLDEKLRQEVEDSKKEKDPKKEEEEEDKGKGDVVSPSEEKQDTDEGEVLTEDKPEDEASPEDKKHSTDSSKPKKQGCNEEEILAVLAHELGHWKMSHTLQLLVIVQVNMFLLLYVFSYFMEQDLVYTSFGFYDSRPTIIGVILVFQFIFTPYYQVLSFLITQFTRRLEYQADQFAADLDKADTLREALTKLIKDNLAFPIADPLYSMFHHSHPTHLERVRVLATSKKKD